MSSLYSVWDIVSAYYLQSFMSANKISVTISFFAKSTAQTQACLLKDMVDPLNVGESSGPLFHSFSWLPES
jgi:hypothetical protein